MKEDRRTSVGVAYAMSWSPSVVNDLFTKFGCSSASTCKTRLAISACFDEAKGIETVLREDQYVHIESNNIFNLQCVPGFHMPSGTCRRTAWCLQKWAC